MKYRVTFEIPMNVDAPNEEDAIDRAEVLFEERFGIDKHYKAEVKQIGGDEDE